MHLFRAVVRIQIFSPVFHLKPEVVWQWINVGSTNCLYLCAGSVNLEESDGNRDLSAKD